MSAVNRLPIGSFLERCNVKNTNGVSETVLSKAQVYDPKPYGYTEDDSTYHAFDLTQETTSIPEGFDKYRVLNQLLTQYCGRCPLFSGKCVPKAISHDGRLHIIPQLRPNTNSINQQD